MSPADYSDQPLPDPPEPWFTRNRKLVVLLGLTAVLLVAAVVTALWRGYGNDQANTDNTNAADTANQSSQLSNRETFVRYPAVTVADADSDGLTDSEEVTLGTNSELADSDGDGLTDREETKVYQTDPLKQDTDGDGRSDGQEVAANDNPAGPGQLRDLESEIQQLTNQ